MRRWLLGLAVALIVAGVWRGERRADGLRLALPVRTGAGHFVSAACAEARKAVVDAGVDESSLGNTGAGRCWGLSCVPRYWNREAVVLCLCLSGGYAGGRAAAYGASTGNVRSGRKADALERCRAGGATGCHGFCLSSLLPFPLPVGALVRVLESPRDFRRDGGQGKMRALQAL